MSIKKAVLKAVNEKIREAQVNCDVEIAILKKERKDSNAKAWESLFVELDRIRRVFKSKEDETVKRHVNSILSKFI